MEQIIVGLIDSASQIEPITDNTSLYSFVFKITYENGRFYLLKISIVYDDGPRPILEKYNFKYKAPVKRSDFINESTMQKTIHTTNFNICPDVIAYGFFNSDIINNIQLKIPYQTREITYLQKYSYFGIMVQEFAIGVPILDNPSPDQIIRIGALLLLLFIDCMVIHIDLHFNNVLCLDLRCVLIDFGNIVSFKQGFETNMELFTIPYTFKNLWIQNYIRGYLNNGEYNVRQKYNDILELLPNVGNNDDSKTKFVNEVFTLILFVNLLIVNKSEYKKCEKLQSKLESKKSELFQLLESKKFELQNKQIHVLLERNKKIIKNLNNEIEQNKAEIEQIEEDIEQIEEDIGEEIEYHKFRYTESRMDFSRFSDMYDIFKANQELFPQIYDAFLANRQNINAYGYKKEKRKKTVTKRKNKTKKRHRK